MAAKEVKQDIDKFIEGDGVDTEREKLSLIHISEPTRPY